MESRYYFRKTGRNALWGTTLPLVLLCVAPCASAQSLTDIERDNEEQITFSNLTFNDAALTGDIKQKWSGSQGLSNSESFVFPPGFSAHSWTGDSNIGISNYSVSGNTASATATSLTGVDGWTDLNISGSTNAYPAFLKTFISNGHWALQLNQSSNGGVAAGDLFIWNLVLPGNWSSQGTGMGQSQLLSYNPSWTLVNDLTYNSGLNETFLTLQESSYDGSGTGVSLQLNGSTAPSPAAVIPFALGALGALRKRRRAA